MRNFDENPGRIEMENGKSAGSLMTGMEVWMRRSDRELKDMADIVAIAKRETVCTVAFHDESCPYLIPLNYGAEVEEGKLVLYFHGAKEETKSIRSGRTLRFHIVFTGKNSLKINYDAACKSTTSFETSAETELHISWKISHRRKKLWRAS